MQTKHPNLEWEAWISDGRFEVSGLSASAAFTAMHALSQSKTKYHYIQIASNLNECPGIAFGDTKESAEANARLIAAAPDLLKAFQAIIEEAGPQYGLDDGPGSVNKMARIARIAIAKATGSEA